VSQKQELINAAVLSQGLERGWFYGRRDDQLQLPQSHAFDERREWHYAFLCTAGRGAEKTEGTPASRVASLQVWANCSTGPKAKE
jgi:hypothetical protein